MCPMCLVGYHASCLGCECDHENSRTMANRLDVDGDTISPETDPDSSRSSHRNSDGIRNPSRAVSSGPTHRLKRDAALKDQQSTGRKRAAKMYPLDREAPCEWRDKANCGGGPYPITGCLNGKQEARHHGPDKSVSNNELGNVHRICHRCHYNWHARNNEEYDWNSTNVQSHNPRPMTETDIIKAAEIDAKYYETKERRIKIKD